MMDKGIQSGYAFGPFRLDALKRCLLREGELVALQPKDFETLLVLVRERERVVGKEELIEVLWPDTFVEEANLSQHIYVIRKALGDAAQNHSYIATVPGRGYRFVAPVIEWREGDEELILAERTRTRLIIEEEEEGQGDRETRGQGDRAFFSRRWLRRIAVTVALLVGLSAVPAWWWMMGKPKQVEIREIKSVAVLPFKPLRADGNDEYLGLGLADSLITRLGSLHSLIVRPTSAVRNYANPAQDPLAAGSEQKVDAVLDATLQRAGNRLRVTARLLRVRDGETMWSYQCDEEYCADIFAMQDAISEEIATALVAQMSGAERQALRKHGTENREAYEQYLRGRYFWNKVWSGQVRKGIECFNQAIAIDPNYALAFAGLADAYWGMIIGQSNALEMMPRAKAAATRALELDSTLAEAHVAMANVQAFHDWNWPEADREFKLALALKPGLVEARLWYNQYLVAMGRFPEAMTEIEQARRLDPLSLQINLRLGDTFYCSGQYDAALTQYRKTLELDSHFPIAHYRIGLIHTLQKRYEEAITEFEKEMASSGMRASVNLAGIARAYALAGKRDEALKYLEEAKMLTEQRRYIMPWAIAVAYAALGDRDQAFAWMEKAYEERPLRLVFLKVDPIFDSLRADPRFANLQRRVGLAP